MNIKFYHLTTSTLEKVLPSLLEKLLSTGKKIHVEARDEDHARTLNDYLWSFSTIRIIPHGMKGEGFEERQPVIVSHNSETLNNPDSYVVTSPKDFSVSDSIKDLLIMFDGNTTTEVTEARELYKKLSQPGNNITYWQQTDDGIWKESNKS